MNAEARAVTGAGTRDRGAFGAAFFLSNFGYELLFFAMTLRVYDISRRAINVGMLAAITLLPKLLSPAYGLFVDRVGARRALAAASAATALLAAGLSALGRIEALYAVWALLSALFMVSANARTVLMTRVASSGYVGANALAFALSSAARLAAPFAAALLSRSVGAGRLMLLASLAYCLCAAGSLAVSRARGDSGAGEAPRAGGDPRARGPFAALGEGFARIRGSGELRALVSLSCVRGLFVGFAPSLLIVVVATRLGRSAADYGLAAAASALGALAGSLAGPAIGRASKSGAARYIGLGLHFASFAALGLVSSFPAAVAILAAGSFALYASAVLLHARRDAATELSTRGRVYGANTTIQTLPQLLSLFAGSAFADMAGAGPVFLVGGLAALTTLAAHAVANTGGLSAPRNSSPVLASEARRAAESRSPSALTGPPSLDDSEAFSE